MRKRGRKIYATRAFASRHLSGAGATLLLPDYDAWNSWGGLASSLITGNRPRTQKPFVSDRAQAKRLLCALDLHARQIAPYLIEKLPLTRCQNSAGCRRRAGNVLPVLFVVIILACGRLLLSILRFFLWRVGRSGTRVWRKECGSSDWIFHGMLCHGDSIAYSSPMSCTPMGSLKTAPYLRKLHRCLNPRGHLILRDVFMSRDRTAPEWGTLFSVSLLLHTPQGRCYALDEILGWLRQAGFSRIRGPFRSSPLPFDPDSILIAQKS